MKTLKKMLALIVPFVGIAANSYASHLSPCEYGQDYTIELGCDTVNGVIYTFYYTETTVTPTFTGARVTVTGCDEVGKNLQQIVVENEFNKVFDEYPWIEKWPVTSVGKFAFSEVAAEEIILNKGLTSGCAEQAFYSCPNLKRVVFTGEWMDFLPMNVFDGCHLEQLVIYGKSLFRSYCIGENSIVEEIFFPLGARLAWAGAPEKYYKDTTALIYGYVQCDGADVDRIILKGADGEIAESSASNFDAYSCAYVKEIHLYVMTPPECSSYAFEEDPNTIGGLPENPDAALSVIKLYVPRAAMDAYKNDPVWGRIKQIYPLEDGVDDTIVADGAIDTDGVQEYYNLQGAKVTNPAPGTVVIRRSGSRVEKVKM